MWLLEMTLSGDKTAHSGPRIFWSLLNLMTMLLYLFIFPITLMKKNHVPFRVVLYYKS